MHERPVRFQGHPIAMSPVREIRRGCPEGVIVELDLRRNGLMKVSAGESVVSRGGRAAWAEATWTWDPGAVEGLTEAQGRRLYGARTGPELRVLVCHGKECVLCPKNSAKSLGD